MKNPDLRFIQALYSTLFFDKDLLEDRFNEEPDVTHSKLRQCLSFMKSEEQ